MSRLDSDLDAANWLNPDDEYEAADTEPEDFMPYCDHCGASYGITCECDKGDDE